MIDPLEVAVIREQLGREPRGLAAVAHRCPCGLPDVVETAPRLPDGTPFPTLYYLTCPRATAAISGLEAAGRMREMTGRLADDAAVRDEYQRAHQDYLARRDAAADAAGLDRLPPGTQSAGGMPERVKCLHALVAHELAVPGANAFGREARTAAGQWWSRGPCVRSRVAAIDCGTNSVRLLIADLDRAHSHLADVTRQMKIVRLGEGVDRTGRLSPAALDRTLGALREYADLIGELSVDAVRMVATSATRDAENAQEFTRRVKEVLGVAPEVITGQEEAALSFTGATRELGAGDYLVTDIGGGSTEFVLGDAGQAGAARSVDIGCVRMTERHLHGDPPTAREVAAATADIDAALDLAAQAIAPGARDNRALSGGRVLVGLAGSVTTVAGIALGLAEYDSAAIHHSRVSAGQVAAIAGQLLAQTRAERAAIGVMHPGRVDVIGAGALILARIMDRFGFEEVLVSEHDILDGIAWSLAGR